MPEQRDPVFYRIGKLVYALYVRNEQTGHRLVLSANQDGLVTSPEGMVDLLERMSKMAIFMGPRDSVTVRVDPSLSEVPDAEDGQGGQARQAAGEEAAGDEGGRQVT